MSLIKGSIKTAAGAAGIVVGGSVGVVGASVVVPASGAVVAGSYLVGSVSGGCAASKAADKMLD